MTDDTYKENPIIRYWQVLVVMCAVVGSASVGSWRLDALAQEVSKNNEEIHEMEGAQAENEKIAVRIETEQKGLKEDVEEIKEDVEKIDAKIDQILQKLE